MALLVGGLAMLADPAGALPPDDPRRGVVHKDLRKDGPQGPCGNAFTVAGDRPGPTRCTHGPDPAPAGVDVEVSQPPRLVPEASRSAGPAVAAAAGAVPCFGDGTSGPRVQLVYARASDRPDRYATYLPSFRQIAAQTDDVFVRSAAETGGARHIRYVTDSACRPSVANVVLSPTGDDTIHTTIDDLVARGFDRPDRKYLVWVDANVYCGIAEIYDDDRRAGDNYNNGNAGVAGMVTRVDSGCWGLSGTNLVEAHELMHNLGGVQATAPHGTGFFHCTDEYDRMCYTDGSGEFTSVVCGATSHDAVFDCNHDDYFSTRPPAGSYLATRWNSADSVFLASTGSVSAWGYNGQGGLGDGTTAGRASPGQVPNLTGVTAVSGGAYHSLALKADGTVVAWGDNSYGQLGDGTTVRRTNPVPVVGLSNVTAVAAGLNHSLALLSDGTVRAWGWNLTGQVGDGTTTDRRLPATVAGLTGVTNVAGGSLHNLARRADGTVWSWGWNTLGQLGDGTTIDRRLAAPVPGLSGITAVAAGIYHSVALKGTDGSVRTWGWNYFGQLGDSTVADRRSPVVVAGLTGMTSVAAGFHHTLAASRSGTVVAWGWNAHGQLGDGTTTDRRIAVPAYGLSSGVTAVAAGAYNSMAVTGAGTVASWGWNYFGQLGDGTTNTRIVPVPVTGQSTAQKLSGGAFHSLSA